MTELQPGDTAPAFSLSDQHGNTVALGDFKGRKLLVYFYPEADTPGCTTQSCDLRDHRQEFAGLGVDVVGISPDEPSKQLAFDQKYSLGFPLLADTDHAAKTMLTGLPAGQHIFYRVRFADLADTRLISEPIEGHFKMPPAEARDAPESFANMVEVLMPTVVNITTTQNVPQQGPRLRDMPQPPPGSPFEELFKEFFDKRGGDEQKRRTGDVVLCPGRRHT